MERFAGLGWENERHVTRIPGVGGNVAFPLGSSDSLEAEPRRNFLMTRRGVTVHAAQRISCKGGRRWLLWNGRGRDLSVGHSFVATSKGGGGQ